MRLRWRVRCGWPAARLLPCARGVRGVSLRAAVGSGGSLAAVGKHGHALAGHVLATVGLARLCSNGIISSIGSNGCQDTAACSASGLSGSWRVPATPASTPRRLVGDRRRTDLVHALERHAPDIFGGADEAYLHVDVAQCLLQDSSALLKHQLQGQRTSQGCKDWPLIVHQFMERR